MANITDGRCYRAMPNSTNSPPLFQNGNLVFQAHHVGWLITGFFTLGATGVSFWLVYKHLKHYTMKREQRYIVRLLLMVPIYANVSLLGYILWNHSTPLLLLRDAYESVVLTSFFYLLLQYLSPTPAGQKEVFRTLPHPVPKKWAFPMGWVKYRPRDGLYFLQLAKWSILQYCFIRPFTTLIAVLMDFAGLYCEDSWGLRWGHPYITIIISISVSVGMYFLIQFYLPLSGHLKPRSPLLKLFAIKAVVFLTFWQATFLGLLATFGVVKDTQYMTADDINIGIGAILECFEMMCFALLHLKAFSYTPYRSITPAYPSYTKWRALLHALDPRDTLRELVGGAKYMWEVGRGRDPEAREVRRKGDLEMVFERRRGESWYSNSITDAMRKREKEKDVVGVSRRGRGWDDEEAWLVEDGADVRSLTSQNLRNHNSRFGNDRKKHRKVNAQYETLPVSSIHNTLEGEDGLGLVGVLDDPPPESLFVSYKGGRKEELKRIREEQGKGKGVDVPQRKGMDVPQRKGTEVPQRNGTEIPQRKGTDFPQRTGTGLPQQRKGTDLPPLPSSSNLTPKLSPVTRKAVRYAAVPTPDARRDATQVSLAATQGHMLADRPVGEERRLRTEATAGHDAGPSSSSTARPLQPPQPTKDALNSLSTRGTKTTDNESDEFYDFDETFVHGGS